MSKLDSEVDDDGRPPPLVRASKSLRRRSYKGTKYKMERFEASDVCPPCDDCPCESETEVAVPKDSWESVSQQPNCELCGMIFKSIPLLQKHVNWSLLHANNMKKLMHCEVEVEAVVPLQEEGVQYKLLYSGSKFYWRTKLMVEIDLHHHLESNTIEVAAFNHSAYMEMKRLYIDSKALTELLADDIAESVEGIRRRVTNADRFAKVDVALLYEQEWRRILATSILSKLKVEAVDGVDELFFRLSCLLPTRPESVVPVLIARKRQTGDPEAIKQGVQASQGQQSVSAKTVGALERVDSSKSTQSSNTSAKRNNSFKQNSDTLHVPNTSSKRNSSEGGDSHSPHS